MTDSSNWDGVYYDRVDGNFVIFDFDHEDADDDQIVMKDAFDGATIHWFDPDEFEEKQDEFSEIDPFYTSDPAGALDDFLRDATEVANHAISGDRLNGYDPVNVEFAVEALRFDRDDEAAWVEHFGLVE